jgi:mortality factor 4-like protein 1
LPRVITVNDVLKRFHDHIKEGMKRRGGREGFDFHYYRRSDDSLNEVVSGIKIYFDRALGNTLLYRFERQQYVDIKSQYPDKSMSDVYGPEHLLRLFGKYINLIIQFNSQV